MRLAEFFNNELEKGAVLKISLSCNPFDFSIYFTGTYGENVPWVSILGNLIFP